MEQITETTRTKSEQAVLDAARALACLRAEDAERARRVEAAKLTKQQAEFRMKEVELLVAQADVAFAAANIRVLAVGQAMAIHLETKPSADVLWALRKRLCASAVAAQDECVLREAHQYAAMAERRRLYDARVDELYSEHQAAIAARKKATKERTSAGQELESAKSALGSADQELALTGTTSVMSYTDLHRLEDKLALAAEALTN